MLSESLKIQKNHCAPDGYTQRRHHHAEVATPSKCCLLLLPDTLFKLLVTNAKLVQVSKIQTKYHAFGRLCQPCHAEGTHLLVHFFTAPAHLLIWLSGGEMLRLGWVRSSHRSPSPPPVLRFPFPRPTAGPSTRPRLLLAPRIRIFLRLKFVLFGTL